MPVLAAIHALGTRAELLIDAPETPALRAVADAAIDELRLWHDRLSLFQPHSFLSHINREAAQRPVPLDEDLWSLLSLCASVYDASGGAFDPTVAGLMSRHGLHPGVEAPVGWSRLVILDEPSRTIHFTEPGVRLDLGAIAKGFALDQAAAILRHHSIHSALLHAGTSAIIAIGDTPRIIAIRAGGALHALQLTDASLCVSAPRGRANDHASHIMDPAQRRSAATIDTAAVRAASCAECDAWATALVVRPDLISPDHLRTAVHDGARWARSDLHLTPIPEAA